MLEQVGLSVVDVRDKRVLLRVDYNVVDRSNHQDARLKATVPTIEYLLAQGAKQVVLMSHFGRPSLPIFESHKEDLSLRPLAHTLGEVLGAKVLFVEQIVPRDVLRAANLGAAKLVLLENLRFYEGEELNNREFAEILATWGDIYVNDAFSCIHRRHASLDAIMEFLPSYPGLCMQKELQYLQMLIPSSANQADKRVAVVGGFKVSSKFGALKNLVRNLDFLLIGGAMANTFLHAIGCKVGNSFVEHEMLHEVCALCDAYPNKIVLPQDVVCLVGDKVLTVAIDSVPASARIYDVGPRTVESFKSYINQGVVIYNGPLGKYEDEHFASASNAMSQYLADMTQSGVITSIVGGGDTLASVTAYEDALIAKFSYASTSGGAMLEWLQNFSLPVVDKLMKHCAGRE